MGRNFFQSCVSLCRERERYGRMAGEDVREGRNVSSSGAREERTLFKVVAGIS